MDINSCQHYIMMWCISLIKSDTPLIYNMSVNHCLFISLYINQTD